LSIVNVMMIVALSMVSALASESTAAESTKLLEGLLERMEEQDKKIVELNEKVIFKIARLDANYRDGLSAKDKELAAQAKEIAALREGDTEREAQIATLRERLQARADKNKDNNNEYGDDDDDDDDNTAAAAAAAKQNQLRKLSSSPPEPGPNKVILRAEGGDTFIIEGGDLNVLGKIIVR
jgi:uncharacterized coiled-coil protein SlyX